MGSNESENMASVTSLDKDLRNMRLEKYTPQRASEALRWIEGILGERLVDQDLLEALKDGTILCRLANLALGPDGVRFKRSAMPFVQMENISHFLRACQSPPLNLQPHDCFLTVDLYEQKDPAQVLQCIGAFSRRAAILEPSKFPSDIEGKRANTISPQASGAARYGDAAGGGHGRNLSEAGSETGAAYKAASPAGGRMSPSKNIPSSPPGASSWARKADIGNAAPAWNIAQYGWTGGASQGNQGVAFGARRQLVSQQPNVPSLAEKERIRREREVEAERDKQQAEEEARLKRQQLDEEERQARDEESRRWEEETRQQRDKERKAAEEEKLRWEAEERRWNEEEDARRREEKDAQDRVEKERGSRPRLQGQFLSQYQAEQSKETGESERIKELERQLEEARAREQQYEEERLRLKAHGTGSSSQQKADRGAEKPESSTQQPAVEDEWGDKESERSYLRGQWNNVQNQAMQPPRPLPTMGSQASKPPPPRPLPKPGSLSSKPATSLPPAPIDAPISPRPLPNPATYVAPSQQQQQQASRTDAFLASNPLPEQARPASHVAPEAALSSGAEQAGEDGRRASGQQKTRAGGWASKSLLEREMERERERQREWEEAQQATRAAYERGDVDRAAGTGPGQSWDVNTYGFTGGDNLNRPGTGVYSGRRQIIGPRDMGGRQ